MAELFGFEIKWKGNEKSEELESFVERTEDDGAMAVFGGGSQASFIDMEGSARTEADLIMKYRIMAEQSDVKSAIDDIVNEAIVTNDLNDSPVDIIVDDVPFPDKIKKRIIEEFEYGLQLLDFSNNGHEKFRDWYVDGRSNFHVIIDEENPSRGILELRYIDSPKIRKVREYEQEKRGQIYVKKLKQEYYLYSENFLMGSASKNDMNGAMTGLKIAKDSVITVNSGITNANKTMILSYLHEAYKASNQLRMLEDAAVIYRIARAPERRVFYIDVGTLPKAKAEQYMRDMMVKHKNKLAYDASTGEIRDDRNFMTMTDDFWLPRREGGRGTEISMLNGGATLGEMTDVEYMQKKLYKALRVPVSRTESDSGFSLGRPSEISREEIKFAKFVSRLRSRFTILFDKFLERQLILKGIITPEDWKDIKNNIRYDFKKDNMFEQMKNNEIEREKAGVVNDLLPLVEAGLYSMNYIYKNICLFTDEEIKQMKKEIDEEHAEDQAKQALERDLNKEDEQDDQGAAPTQFVATLKPAATPKQGEDK
jgi:hypothetical protein